MYVATITDLLDYVIADEVVAIGCIDRCWRVHFISGDFQIIHIWVNWDHQVPGLYGPYRPEWMAAHQHLHGLAWSMAGMANGSFADMAGSGGCLIASWATRPWASEMSL